MTTPNKVTFKIYELVPKLIVTSADEEWAKNTFNKFVKECPDTGFELVRLEESEPVIVRTKKDDSDE